MRKIKISLLSAALVFLLGFGVLNVFWYFFDNSDRVKGLYDYYAATIGDAICLPILVAGGLYYILINDKICKKDTKTLCLVGIVAAFMGVIIQASWLISDDTELNWTIPRLHSFNAAGWWHAIYFTVMCAIIASIITAVIITNFNIDMQEQCKGKYSKAIMWGAGISYCYMHVLDDYVTGDNCVEVLAFTSLIMTVLFIVTENISSRNLDLKILNMVVSIEIFVFLIIIYSR